MYIVQVKQLTETWIVTISQHKEDATEYLATLSAEIQAAAFLYEIPFEYYSFILIENIHEVPSSDSYFEFCDFEDLQRLIDALHKYKINSK